MDATRQRDRRMVGKISRRPSAWLAWLLWVLIVVPGEAVVIPYQIDWFYLTHPHLLDGEGIVEVFGGLIMVLAIAEFATVGAVVSTLRPKNGVGWLCLAVGLLLVLVGVQPGVATYGVPWRVLEPMQSVAWNLTVPPLPVTLMLLIFPDGRLLSRRWWAVVAVALVGYFLAFLGVFMPGGDAQAGVPIGVLISIAALLASVASMVLRWRRSTDRERQQLKWLVYIVAVPVLAGLASLFVQYIWAFAYVPASVLLGAGVGLGIPTAIGIAILKYRLYDIDRIINRTLVYGSLTALLAAGYIGTIMVLQVVSSLPLQMPVHAITGQEQPSYLIVIVSTLAMAALFSPLRRRIQSFIDRSFYRRKYDAHKTLEEFSEKLRDETDLEALSGDLLGVVRETMQPAHVSLWLRPETARKRERA